MDLLRWKEQRQGREDVLLAVRTRWFDDAVLAAAPAPRRFHRRFTNFTFLPRRAANHS
jgi:hypothetical protein